MNQPSPRSAVPRAVAEEGIVVTDMSLRPIAIDSGADAILRDPGGDQDAPQDLPPELVSALRRCKQSAPSAVRTEFQKGSSKYRCRAYVVEPRNGVLKQPVLALVLQKQISIEDAIAELSAEYALTEREQEAVRGISMGLASKELADRMQISPNTVKAFLRLIMIKMGVTSRAGVIAKVLDYMEGDSQT